MKTNQNNNVATTFRNTIVVAFLITFPLFSCVFEEKTVVPDTPVVETDSPLPISDVKTEASVIESDGKTHDALENSGTDKEVFKNNLPKPAAIPVLTKEEADALVEKMKQEEEDAKKRGIIFYREKFLVVQGVADRKDDKMYKNIQETPNWAIVQKDIEGDSQPSARKQGGYFSIQSDIPLDYSFVFPLSEHAMYCYTLSTSIKGKGKVVLQEKNSDLKKDFKVDSQIFETFVLPLGKANTFSQKIVPIVSFSGDLQIESITIQQKKINTDRTVCLGTIEAISKVPDIKKANYPDCFYTAQFSTKEIIDGTPIPETIQLLIPAFRNSKIDPLSKLMRKGNWKIVIRPFSSAPDDEQEIEQVDDLESYEFTPYILVNAVTANIPALHVESGIPILEGKEYNSPYDNPINPPINGRYKDDSQKIIAQELKKVEAILATAKDVEAINANFQKHWDKKQKGYEPVYAGSSMLWIREKDSFFALPKQWNFIHPREITEENLQALIELDRFFKSQGLVFILQIVPNLYDIAALVLNPDFQKYGDQQSAVVAKQLLENGIEAQYISDEIVKHAFDYERLFVYPGDFHPEGASDVMTTIMAKRLELFREILPKQYSPELFTRVMEDTVKTWPSNTKLDIGDHKHGSFVQTPHIYYDGKLLQPTAESKIMVFGNSFVGSPQSKAFGFVSYLTSKLLYNSSARTMGGVSALTGVPQLFLTDTSSLLKGKQIVVLPISIEFLSGEGYNLTNVKLLDSKFKEMSSASFISSVSPAEYSESIYPVSTNFKYKTLRNYFLSRTGCVALSAEQLDLTIPVPVESKPKKARISLQPYYLPVFNYTASIIINDSFNHQLISNYQNPNWEVIDYEIPENTKNLTIKLDITNSSKDAMILIQDISFYQ